MIVHSVDRLSKASYLLLTFVDDALESDNAEQTACYSRGGYRAENDNLQQQARIRTASDIGKTVAGLIGSFHYSYDSKVVRP